MKKMTGNEIRQMWLDFFKSKGHEVIPSASLIPNDDPTLLWINAGVAPLKKYFDGRMKPTNPRMCNAQKSLRTNDIENVGKTARHHTFFEMLGNFSIGDYFRNEALTWAYELLTSPKWFDLDVNKLYITYYPDDHDTFNKWCELGIAADHLIPLKDNFWEIGEGPCGPDTEIFFDRGEKYDPEKLGLKLLVDDIENDRYIEIWNIVFSQYNSKTNLKRSEYPELPSKNIDTGSGLERLACIMQEVDTNYESDLFMPMIKFLEEYTGVKYTGQMAFRVIVDHIRSVTFAVADGAILSNDGRGYVLRRILRRAVRYGRKLGINDVFLYKMVDVVVKNMKDFYPYLEEKQTIIENIIKVEEENFLKTLGNGEKRLNDLIKNLQGNMISGSDAFLLYDTFGFPIELTVEAAAEKNVLVDVDGYKEQLELQKKRARESRTKMQSMNSQNEAFLQCMDSSKFIGYDQLECTTTIIGVFKGNKRVEKGSNELVFICSETPFYAESGGQIGDQGILTINGEEFHIDDTIKLPNGQHGHVVDTKETVLGVGTTVKLSVDVNMRQHISYNHSATHLLGQSLRNVLGSHVVQQGSQVTPNRLRFDFNHYKNPTEKEIIEVENLVNEAIKNAYDVHTILTTVSEAVKAGAQAVFGEKYGDVVRMVDMGYSKELCGGTHVKNTKEIGAFAILSVESKGSGIFRVEAATSDMIAVEMAAQLKNLTTEIDNLKSKEKNLIEICTTENISIKQEKPLTFKYINRYQDILTKREEYNYNWRVVKDMEREYENKKLQKQTNAVNDLTQDVVTKDDISFLIKLIKDVDMNVLKELVDKEASLLNKCFILMASSKDDKVYFVAKSKNCDINCGQIVKEAAAITGGAGGGRPDFAQAGGKDATKIEIALNTIKEKLKV